LKLKLTIQVSPRTVGKYLHKERPVRTPDPKQRWLTFVRNQAKVMVACDFFVPSGPPGPLLPSSSDFIQIGFFDDTGTDGIH
jgi:hypothetical protein